MDLMYRIAGVNRRDCGICGICRRNLYSVGQTSKGSRAKTALIFLSWDNLHLTSLLFHQVTIVLSFHLGFAALAILASVALKPCALAFALKAAISDARSVTTGSTSVSGLEVTGGAGASSSAFGAVFLS
jgi:hypothetical protein